VTDQPNAFKVTLFFPVQDNQKRPFTAEIWSWWEDELAKLVTGFTDLGVVMGWWLGHSDQNRWIVIVVKTERQVERIKNFVRAARVKFRQDTMYFESHPVYFEEVQ